MRSEPVAFPKEATENLEKKDDIDVCNDVLRKRWINEYLKVLNERQSVTGTSLKNLDVGSRADQECSEEQREVEARENRSSNC